MSGAPAAATHCELTLTRDRRAEVPATTVVLRTVEGPPLSARVLNPFFEAGDWLGANATVEGTLQLRQQASKDWEASFSGGLHEIDLTRLIGQRFPRHRLTGRGSSGRDDGAIGAHGPARAPAGSRPGASSWPARASIAVSLLRALAREMQFRLSPRLAHLDPRKTEVEFRALGLAFDLRANGEIHLAGALGSDSVPDVVLAGATTPLASAPQGTVSVHGLIKTLFPVADASPGVLVPLTPESSVLLALPVAPEADSKVRRAAVGN